MLNMHDEKLIRDITQLKSERSVFIIAHYYQRDDVHTIADFVGDSYSMAIQAKECTYDTILVAGVDFMAETAAILCPYKTILTPEPNATCPMANTITKEVVLKYKEEHPDGIVVCYVNTPAEVKAVSDICCTSSNAQKIIQKLPKKADIFFIPDEYLGLYISEKANRPMDLYTAHCPTHKAVKTDHLIQLRMQYPNAKIIVHPECHPDVVRLADYVGSTRGIVEYAAESKANSFIIGTECGVLSSLKKQCPDKNFILANEDLICPNMKSITLEKILYSLENLEIRVTVPEHVRDKAVLSLEKMIEYSS